MWPWKTTAVAPSAPAATNRSPLAATPARGAASHAATHSSGPGSASGCVSPQLVAVA